MLCVDTMCNSFVRPSLPSKFLHVSNSTFPVSNAQFLIKIRKVRADIEITLRTSLSDRLPLTKKQSKHRVIALIEMLRSSISCCWPHCRQLASFMAKRIQSQHCNYAGETGSNKSDNTHTQTHTLRGINSWASTELLEQRSD